MVQEMDDFLKKKWIYKRGEEPFNDTISKGNINEDNCIIIYRNGLSKWDPYFYGNIAVISRLYRKFNEDWSIIYNNPEDVTKYFDNFLYKVSNLKSFW